MNSSYKLGALLFIIGLALVFLPRYSFNILFSPTFYSTGIEPVDFLLWSSGIGAIMIVAEVVLYYKGRKENTSNAASQNTNTGHKN